MRKRRKRNSCFRFAAVAAAVIILLLSILFWIKAEKAIRPAAVMQAEHYARRRANETISSVISEYLDESRYTYSDFAAVLYDENGRVVSVEAMPYNINKAQSELTMRINNSLRNVIDGTVEVPVGTLSGKYLLAGKGPKLKVRICPAEEAEVRLKSEFRSGGMNQTVHSISAVINVYISSSMPLYSFDTEVSFEYLLAESVIVGNVPSMSRYAWSSFEN